MTREPLWIVTIRPGPALHVWRDGDIFLELPLPPVAALEVASRLLHEASIALRDDVKA